MVHEKRKTRRYPVALKVWLETPAGEAEGVTRAISRGGFSFVGELQVEVDDEVHAALYMLDGNVCEGKAICRSHPNPNERGFEFFPDAHSAQTWNETLEWEESHGSVWRMASRFADEDQRISTLPMPADALGISEEGPSLPSEPSMPPTEAVGEPDGRSVVFDMPTTDVHTVEPLPNTDHGEEEGASRRLRFYTVGEGGEAYRLAFEKHDSEPPGDCDLHADLPGFAELSRRAVKRVLRREMTIRFDAYSPAMGVRVVEMKRGGYAYVQGVDGGTVGLGSLAIGELVLIEVDDVQVFPYFDDHDLEVIAKDAFRTEREKTALLLSNTPFRVLGTGLDAIREAQADSHRVEQRIYGNRTLSLYPDVLVRSMVDGHALRGPTMADPEKNRVLLLALQGEGAPRVVPLTDDMPVALVGPEES